MQTGNKYMNSEDEYAKNDLEYQSGRMTTIEEIVGKRTLEDDSSNDELDEIPISPPGDGGKTKVQEVFERMQNKRKLFPDKDDLCTLLEVSDGVERFYKKDSKFADFAVNQYFEYVTLTIISINAIWIGYDADSNTSETGLNGAHLKFILAENIFCFYFSFEIIIRFISFQSKWNCWRDAWFVFDTLLVLAMMLETWIIPLLVNEGDGPAGISLLRLFRLLRLTRMARIMRAVPELMTLVKGMLAATRSVLTTLLLLVIILYIFGIVFVMFLKREPMYLHRYGNLSDSMFSLFLGGTLLDDVTSVFMDLRDEALPMLYVMFIFVLFSSFTILNMLIGVLCEVAAATKESEEQKAAYADASSKLLEVFHTLDVDNTNTISKSEFFSFSEHEKVVEAFEILGIEGKHLMALSDGLFEPEPGDLSKERELTFNEFLDVIIHMRPGTPASVIDLATFTTCMRIDVRSVLNELEKLENNMKNTTSKIRKGNRRVLRRQSQGQNSSDNLLSTNQSELDQLQNQILKLRMEYSEAENSLREKRKSLHSLQEG